MDGLDNWDIEGDEDSSGNAAGNWEHAVDSFDHVGDNQADSSTVGGVVALTYLHLGNLPICFPQKYWLKSLSASHLPLHRIMLLSLKLSFTVYKLSIKPILGEKMNKNPSNARIC